MIEPPVGIVRALPPHAIRDDGVGPYRLGDKLSDLLAALPSGPRITMFEVPRLLHRSLIRAEDDTVLIGGEPAGTATLVAVIDADVARTESGIHVGMPRTAIGLTTTEVNRVRDPRLIVPMGLPSVRVVIVEDRIKAIVVTSELPTPSPPRLGTPLETAADRGCSRPEDTEKGYGACLLGIGERVEVVDSEVTIRAIEPARTIASLRIPAGVVFTAPLRTVEGRDELIVVTRTDSENQRRWALTAYRFDGGKITRTIDNATLYQLTSSNARWIGAELAELELFLELANRIDGIEVGGLLATGVGDLVAISPITINRRQRTPPASEGSGAAPPPATEASGSAVDEPQP